jgi:hypothetical protein
MQKFKFHLLLGLAVVQSGVIASLWIRQPQPVHAQSASRNLFVEPGVHMLRAPDGSRQVLGKVFVDLNTGDVWGFPTTTPSPFPVDVANSVPPVSKPFRLGQYDLSLMRRSAPSNE